MRRLLTFTLLAFSFHLLGDEIGVADSANNDQQTVDESQADKIPNYIGKNTSPPPPPKPNENEAKVPVEDKHGKYHFEYIPIDEPFLTGPLLCPSGHTIPYGHINLEPYVFINNNIGYYNNRWHVHKASKPQDNINFQYLIQCGISDIQDFSLIPQLFYNFSGNKQNVNYGDFVVLTAFQLYKSRFDSWIPTTKIEFGETFPTGKYDELDITQLGTDLTGGGSYGTSITLVGTDLWYFGNHHFLALRLSNSITFFTNVKVTGSNAYGGDATTSGTAKPGPSYTCVLGSEFTLTRHWALALDIDATYTWKTRFSGTTIAPVGRDSSFLLSFAPAVEYNFTPNVGLIAGAWLSAIGENSLEFYNGVVALNWYFP